MRCFAVIAAIAILATSAHSAEDELLATVIDGESDRIPTLTVAPKYPRKARRDRVEGEVQVCFDIDRKGRPRGIAVRRSSNRAFEKPSMKAVRRSEFAALQPDEALQSIKSCRTFVFSLVPATD